MGAEDNRNVPAPDTDEANVTVGGFADSFATLDEYDVNAVEVTISLRSPCLVDASESETYR